MSEESRESRESRERLSGLDRALVQTFDRIVAVVAGLVAATALVLMLVLAGAIVFDLLQRAGVLR
jgi:hypothetical protein